MNAADVVKWGDDFLQRTLMGLPESEWDTQGVCGWWSVKDILAHLASYEQVLCEALSPFAGEPAGTAMLEAMSNHARFNDEQVAKRQSMPWQDVLAEYNALHAGNMKLVGMISPDTLRLVGSIPWYGTEYSLDDFIVYQYYGHKREHGAQISVFTDTLK